jgi:hypothetical protein
LSNSTGKVNETICNWITARWNLSHRQPVIFPRKAKETVTPPATQPEKEKVKATLLTKSIEADGCFGELWFDADLVAFTLERTFDDVRPIIPAGTFKCVKTHFERGNYDTYEITGVEGHSRLLFHKGNTETDSVGCVLVGSSVGMLNGHKAILASAVAFDKFMERLKGILEFDLEILGR